MTQNQLQYWANQENKRTNLAKEAELKRHQLEMERQGREDLARKAAADAEVARANAARESIQSRSNEISSYSADTSRFEQQERARSNRVNELLNNNAIYETSRSNRAREAENYRSNLAREAETHRSNVSNENLTNFRNTTNYTNAVNQLTETKRHNVASEGISRTQTASGLIGSIIQTVGRFAATRAGLRIK